MVDFTIVLLVLRFPYRVSVFLRQQWFSFCVTFAGFICCSILIPLPLLVGVLPVTQNCFRQVASNSVFDLKLFYSHLPLLLDLCTNISLDRDLQCEIYFRSLYPVYVFSIHTSSLPI